jgi:hypothetical protein
MPVVARIQNADGEAAILEAYGSLHAFEGHLLKIVARNCNTIYGTSLVAGDKVKMESRHTTDSLRQDICIRVTLWKGPSWPDLPHHASQVALLRQNLETRLAAEFRRLDKPPTIRVVVCDFDEVPDPA